jgi:hypothetical protein
MATLTALAGLPGSGKSCYLAQLAPTLSGVCADDFMEDSVGNSPEFPHSMHFAALIADLRRDRDCLAADITFCLPERRREFEAAVAEHAPGTRFRWVFFENDPRRCIITCVLRNEPTWPEEVKLILELAPRYEIPPGVQPLPVPRQPTGAVA